MKKIKVYIDMDGTIADLYNMNDWLNGLRKEKEGVFINLDPLITQKELLKLFPLDFYDLCIFSMTPKDASREYCAQVIKEKNLWLDRYFPAIKKRIYRKYGDNKNLKNSQNAILVDDNKVIRKNFRGLALDPVNLW